MERCTYFQRSHHCNRNDQPSKKFCATITTVYYIKDALSGKQNLKNLFLSVVDFFYQT